MSTSVPLFISVLEPVPVCRLIRNSGKPQGTGPGVVVGSSVVKVAFPLRCGSEGVPLTVGEEALGVGRTVPLTRFTSSSPLL